MKSNFFGLNAKLALAVLAISGSMLTGCYESEKDDVTPPYNPPAPVYIITGSITDAETNAPINGAAIKGGITATTDANGVFKVTLTDAPAEGTDKTYSITIEATGYNSVTRSVIVTGIAKGGTAVYTVSAALTKPAGSSFNDDNVTSTVTTVKLSTKTSTFGPVEFGDIINDTEQAKSYTVTITVDTGATDLDAAGGAKNRAADFSSLQAYGDAWIKGQVGDFTKGFVPVNLDVEIQLPPLTRLIGMSINTFYATQNFNFVSAGVDPYNQNNIQSVSGYTVPMPTFESIGHDHTHGHDHGHGTGMNAGGGDMGSIQ